MDSDLEEKVSVYLCVWVGFHVTLLNNLRFWHSISKFKDKPCANIMDPDDTQYKIYRVVWVSHLAPKSMLTTKTILHLANSVKPNQTWHTFAAIIILIAQCNF